MGRLHGMSASERGAVNKVALECIPLATVPLGTLNMCMMLLYDSVVSLCGSWHIDNQRDYQSDNQTELQCKAY